jgi:hypothetical protein
MVSGKGLAAIACAALAACGGGGTGGPDPDAPRLSMPAPLAATACAPTGVVTRIQLFGDSTAGGYTHFSRVDETPARLLQADMDALFGTGAVVVEDRSAPSTTALRLLAGTDGVNAPWPGSVNADLVVINHAINDAGQESVAAYHDVLAQLAVASPAPVVFETPNPIFEGALDDYVQAMRQVANMHGAALADTYTYVRNFPYWSSYYTDWAHPSQVMYAHIERYALLPALLPLVKQRRCQ